MGLSYVYRGDSFYFAVTAFYLVDCSLCFANALLGGTGLASLPSAVLVFPRCWVAYLFFDRLSKALQDSDPSCLLSLVHPIFYFLESLLKL